MPDEVVPTDNVTITAVDPVISMSEGIMQIGGFKTKGFRLYSLIVITLFGLFGAIYMKVDPSNIAIIATVVGSLVGAFANKKD